MGEIIARNMLSWLKLLSSTSSWSPAGNIVGTLYHELKTQSCAPEDGRNYRPKHVELIEIVKFHYSGHRQATSSVHYTTSCKHSLVLLRMGEIIARNMLSWLKLLIKLSLLHQSAFYITLQCSLFPFHLKRCWWIAWAEHINRHFGLDKETLTVQIDGSLRISF